MSVSRSPCSKAFSTLAFVVVQLLSHICLFVTPWTTEQRALQSMDFPGKNTGAGCHFLVQGILLAQGSMLAYSLPTRILTEFVMREGTKNKLHFLGSTEERT